MTSFVQHELYFNIYDNNHTATVTRCPECGTKVTIPSTITYNSSSYPVVSIEPDAFRYNRQIDELSFPQDTKMRRIEAGAFAFSSIHKINIPASLERVDPGALNGANNLTEISVDPFNSNFIFINNQYLMKRVKKDGEFLNCLIFARPDIEVAVIPADCIRIGEMAFAFSQNLQTITFEPHSILRSIEKDAFFQSTIRSISFPSKLDNLEDGWCHQTPLLRNIEVAKSNRHVKYFNDQLLIQRSREDNKYILLFARRDIKEVIIPFNIILIDQYAFEYCKNLKSVVFGIGRDPETQKEIPSALERIGYKAFSSCFKLKHLAPIPINVDKICDYAFENCTSLREVKFESGDYEKEDPKLDCFGIGVFASCTDLEKVFGIPAALKKCPISLFSRDKNLVEVEFLSTELQIQKSCFEGNPKLEKVSIPNAQNITIHKSAFGEVSPNFQISTPKTGKVVYDQRDYDVQNNEQEKEEKEEKVEASFFERLKQRFGRKTNVQNPSSMASDDSSNSLIDSKNNNQVEA